MKFILIILLTFFGLQIRLYAQLSEFEQDKIDIIGTWMLEEEEASRWVFTSNNKAKAIYLGIDEIIESTYKLHNTPPKCEGASLSYDKNVPYLELIEDGNNIQTCFYIHALNDKRLTTVDAVTGHIGIWVRVE